MDNLTLARKLEAAAIAIRYDGAYSHREMLVSLCAEVQKELAPPVGDLTWRSHDGRVWKFSEMEDDHLVKSLFVLLRRPQEGQSPLFGPMYEEAWDRFQTRMTGSHNKRRRQWFRRQLERLEGTAVFLGWVERRTDGLERKD